MNGTTLKQMGINEFFSALAAYKKAKDDFLINPQNEIARTIFLRASMSIHRAKGLVPKKYHRLVKKI